MLRDETCGDWQRATPNIGKIQAESNCWGFNRETGSHDR